MITLIQADARRIPLPDGSIHCVVTSPPYFSMRDYRVAGQIGLEASPDAYVAAMVGVFREVWRVLRDDATVWLNLGDGYANDTKWGGHSGLKNQSSADGGYQGQRSRRQTGLKPKDLIGIPWRVAFAFQDDGWYLRSEIIWHKRSPMPESTRDRPTKSHEKVFLLAKRPRYFYDDVAVREKPQSKDLRSRRSSELLKRGSSIRNKDLEQNGLTRGKANQSCSHPDGRNLRDVWTLSHEPFPGAHFATYPTKLVIPCIKAGTSERGCCPSCGAPWKRLTNRTAVKRERPNDLVKRQGEEGNGNACPNTAAGVSVATTGWAPSCKCEEQPPVPCRVLDPFNGSGTTGVVADNLGRDYYGLDLSRPYLDIARERISRPHRPRGRKREVASPLFGDSV